MHFMNISGKLFLRELVAQGSFITEQYEVLVT